MTWMKTEDLEMSTARFALCQRLMQKSVGHYGWDPKWEEYPETVRRVAETVQSQYALGKTVDQAVMQCYCYLWYEACSSQDVEQQTRAFTSLHAYLYRLVYARTYDAEIAEEAANQSNLIIWQSLKNVRDPGAFVRFVQQIAVRQIFKLKESVMNFPDNLDALEEQEGNSSAVISDNDDAHEDEMADSEEDEGNEQNAVRQEVEDVIRRCLRSKAQQEVFVQNMLQNRTLQQIAKQLDKTPNHVGVLKHRALNSLRKCPEMQKLNERYTQKRQSAQQTKVDYLLAVIRGETDTTLTCDQVADALPNYVDAELAGQDVRTLYPELKRHLDHCLACEFVYSEMLTIALTEQRSALLPTPPIPKPDLSFLPPLTFFTLARTLVHTVTKQALITLAPNALPSLAQLGDRFFQRVEVIGGLLTPQPSPALASGLGGDPTAATLVMLTTSYLTTQQIAQRFSRVALQAQMSAGQLAITLQQAALQAAIENGMNQSDAQAFAQIYAAEASREPAAWLLLSDQMHSL